MPLQRKSLRLLLLCFLCFSGLLLGHVVFKPAPDPDFGGEPLPDLATARQTYAYALGFDYGQRFRSVNNLHQLPLKAFIEGLQQAASDGPSAVDPKALEMARLVLQNEPHTPHASHTHP